MKRQAQLFLTAMMFFTRIPVRLSSGHNMHGLLQSAIYFPWIGWIVGLSSAVTLYVFGLVVSGGISVFMSMLCSIFITGAFHEDGFADVCDGFGGGWTKEKILAIMKDSRLGTFGVIGLIAILGAKFLLLSELLSHIGAARVCGVVITAHVLSRFTSLTMLPQYQYVSGESGKAGFSNRAEINGKGWTIAILPVFALFVFGFQVLLFVLAAALVRLALGRYFHKWIGGYTGDCLGAVQQVTEVIIYLMMVLIWKYTL